MSSTVSVILNCLTFNRARTMKLLEEIAATAKSPEVLAFRPGPGRAHLAWQLAHIGVTEELFATERLVGISPAWPELVPRFRGGSTPDDNIPTIEDIRGLLETSRAHLLPILEKYSEDDLNHVPEALKERGWTVNTVLQVLCWHEAHHQGQAHLTFNLWKAAGS